MQLWLSNNIKSNLEFVRSHSSYLFNSKLISRPWSLAYLKYIPLANLSEVLRPYPSDSDPHRRLWSLAYNEVSYKWMGVKSRFINNVSSDFNVNKNHFRIRIYKIFSFCLIFEKAVWDNILVCTLINIFGELYKVIVLSLKTCRITWATRLKKTFVSTKYINYRILLFSIPFLLSFNYPFLPFFFFLKAISCPFAHSRF